METTKSSFNLEHSAGESAPSRELLLRAAQYVFAEKGYEGATVKDLADAAGVNISLISYYFNGKEGLFKACLEGFGRKNVESAERILKPAATVQEFKLRLQLFAEHFIALNQEQPCICRIIQRDFEFQDPARSETARIVMDIFARSFLPMHHRLSDFIKTAQQNGILRASMDVEVATGLLFGSLIQLIRMDEKRKIFLGHTLLDKQTQDHTIMQYIEIFTHGIIVESAP